MKKRILPIILCVCLLFSISVMAANSTDSTTSEIPDSTEELPAQGGGGRQGGFPGGMGRPSGENAPGSKALTVPEGEVPAGGGEMPPPEERENTQPENGEQTQPVEDETAAGATMEESFPGGRQNSSMNGDMQNNIPYTGEIIESQAENGILEFVKTYSTPIFAVILLMLAYVFVFFYKRKRY